MPRRYFRKLMPPEDALRGNRVLALFGATVLNRRLWQLNRHSSAMGAAAGVFWAWIALPGQTIGAIATAIVGRGNVPLATAFTWVSNPLTWLPCFWLAYEVGLPITPAERIDVWAVVEPVMHGDLIGGTKRVIADLPRLYPMYVGGALLGAVTGAVTYLSVSLLWKWHVARRWRRRHDQRRTTTPLNGGFAHLARLRLRQRAA